MYYLGDYEVKESGNTIKVGKGGESLTWTFADSDALISDRVWEVIEAFERGDRDYPTLPQK